MAEAVAEAVKLIKVRIEELVVEAAVAAKVSLAVLVVIEVDRNMEQQTELLVT